MREVEINDEKSIFAVFDGLASRCTAGTGMNDSSSRTHCFVWLTLRMFHPVDGTVRESRFQFCDLAGSERIKDAHNSRNYKDAGSEGLTGLLTNYSLVMLSTAVRELVRLRKSNRGGGVKNKKRFSFRTYLFDLVLLLSESLTGKAFTAVFVCLSQSPANASQSVNALDFGKEFSKLGTKAARTPVMKLETLIKEAKKLKRESKCALEKNIPEKFKMIRGAQMTDAEQRLKILQKWEKGEKVSENCK
eukprot:g5038.t1